MQIYFDFLARFAKKCVTLHVETKVKNYTYIGMGQLQERFKSYREPQKYMEADVYPYFRAIEGKQGTEVEMGGHKVLMFGLSLIHI